MGSFCRKSIFPTSVVVRDADAEQEASKESGGGSVGQYNSLKA